MSGLTITNIGGHYHKMHMSSSGPNVPGPPGPHGSVDPSEFKLDDYVEFPGCPGPLFQISGGESPFWMLEHVGGPRLPDNYWKAMFGTDPPKTSSVIETVIAHVPGMKVLAIMADEA